MNYDDDDVLDLDDLRFPVPSRRVPSRSVARALRLAASARKRQKAFQALAAWRQELLEHAFAARRQELLGKAPGSDPSQLS